ncbi:hypothetical protein [Haloarcula argentinensis]|uniref:Uncharacterized protein n=1 Tax=Haloarcula argentinensis TaxID=43776 RepID=A0A847UL36_HALAR|nr:hypothetical protein [Haloarcula argentinensis]NLV14369.1 hypothetical protein [Haloarcula argentinensis]
MSNNWTIRAVNDDGEPTDDSDIRLVGTATNSEAGGAFEDTDGDDVAELQRSAADMQGGDLRNAGRVGMEEALYARNNTGHSNRLSSRPLVSTQDRTITVGTDTDTIQEALNEIPLLLRHEFVIDIPDGTYDEDLLVPTVMHADTAGRSQQYDSDEGVSQNPWIQGNTSTPSNVTVNSISVASSQAAGPVIEGLQVTGIVPYDDEDAGVVVYGSQNFSFRHMSFAGCSASIGILAYSSAVTVREAVDFGTDDLTYGLKTKHNARLHVDTGPSNDPVTGSVTDYVIWIRGGSFVTHEGMTATGGSGTVWNEEGYVRETDTYKDMQSPQSSSDPGLAFGTWRQVSPDRPAKVTAQVTVETDGSSNGIIQINVDESGGTTPDYDLFVVADAGLGSGGQNSDSVTLHLPAGAQYQIQNGTDPNAANAISHVREFVL